MALSPFHGPYGIHLNSMALEKPESRFQINICYPPREREFRGQAMRRNVNMYQGNKGGIKKKNDQEIGAWWGGTKPDRTENSPRRLPPTKPPSVRKWCLTSHCRSFASQWDGKCHLQYRSLPHHPSTLPPHPSTLPHLRASLLPSPPAPEGRGSVSIGKCGIGA